MSKFNKFLAAANVIAYTVIAVSIYQFSAHKQDCNKAHGLYLILEDTCIEAHVVSPVP